MNYHYIALGLFAVISLFTVALTVFDKLAAKAGRRRVPENTLLLVGFFGGALSEFITMLLIRHKTKHLKFMLLLPLFIVIQAAVLYALHVFVF